MADLTLIKATLSIELEPWSAPNFAKRAGAEEREAIPVRELDDDALEDLALAWVRDLYKKAGRAHCPFYKPAKVAKPQ